MERRVTVALTGLIGAVLVGGVSQAYLWRWGLDGLAGVTSSQYMWVLLTFGVSWGWAHGRLRDGAAAGGLTGLALIASYYALQWAVDGRHSAVAQFSKTGGPAWTLAALGGGAVMGLFGALAGLPARDHPRLKALGITVPAVIVGAGPSLWLLLSGAYLDASSRVPAVAVFLLVGAALVGVAARTCGLRACAHALALSIGLGAVALAGLWLLQTQGWLYLTF